MIGDDGERMHGLGDDKVGSFASRNRSHLIADAHRISGIECTRIERLHGGEAHANATHSHHETHVTAGRRTGVVIAGEGNAQSGFDERFGTSIWQPEEER